MVGGRAKEDLCEFRASMVYIRKFQTSQATQYLKEGRGREWEEGRKEEINKGRKEEKEKRRKKLIF